MQPSDTEVFTISIAPGSRKIRCSKGWTLLEALVDRGILLRSDCGGKGLCGKCIVKIMGSKTTVVEPPDETEKKIIGKDRLDAGYRLACRTVAASDMAIQIPETTLLSPEVMEKGPTSLQARLADLKPFTASTGTYGVAIDLGTTTIAVYLCNLFTREVIASTSIKNPQAIFGDDVMSRISAISIDSADVNRLQRMAVKAIEWGIFSACRSTRTGPETIETMTVVGNSTMIHLFVGKNPESIGVFPYAPQFKDAKMIRAEVLGFGFNPSTRIHTLPLISGFLGSDIIAAALAVNLAHLPPGTMLVDVGTNGEVMLVTKNGLIATSCATGPAFEGAAIDHGMHAISGAIDAVRIVTPADKPEISVIQKDRNNPKMASGICGTGVISGVAELLKAGILLPDGRFNREAGSSYLKYAENGMPEFVLAAPEETQTGREIALTQKDIRAIQLAKGALSAGIQLLCREAGIERPERILVAGAFGNFIHKKDALTIGMFPDIPLSDIHMVGNAAGAGAILALFGSDIADEANGLSGATRILDLASLEAFQETFVSSLSFPSR